MYISIYTCRKFLVCRFFFSSRRRHTRCYRDWSSDVCSSDLFIHDVTPEETVRLPEGTIRVKNRMDVRTSRVQQDWWLEDQNRLLGQTDIRLYSAHELLRMLRPERWSQVELFGR